jgi:hypothetical protein
MSDHAQPIDGNALFEHLREAERRLRIVAQAIRRTEASTRDGITAGAVDTKINILLGRMAGLVALDHPAAARRFKVARVTGTGTGQSIGPKVRDAYETPHVQNTRRNLSRVS